MWILGTVIHAGSWISALVFSSLVVEMADAQPLIGDVFVILPVTFISCTLFFAIVSAVLGMTDMIQLQGATSYLAWSLSALSLVSTMILLSDVISTRNAQLGDSSIVDKITNTELLHAELAVLFTCIGFGSLTRFELVMMQNGDKGEAVESSV
tara:strand:- start:15461 stop:15919 length:459 start_codon:yes stop_codon:yes gene_type:complete